MNFFFKILILIMTLTLFSCKEEVIIQENQKVSNFDLEKEVNFIRFKFSNNSYAGQTELSKNKKTESGKYAKFNDGETSQYKIGLWKEYYENGQIKEEGKYLIGRYVQCCFSGHCLRYYNYKVGKWKYYYQNGTLELDGDYSIKKLWIDTNCGGDYIKYGILDSETKFYDQSGKRIKKNIESLKLKYEKEYTRTHPGMYLIPLKENDTIISIGFSE